MRKVSERIRVDKLRRVSASVGLGNKSSGGALSLRKKSSRRRNQRTKFTKGTSRGGVIGILAISGFQKVRDSSP
jgi:hypothetical protein